jgi:hypothetical protein
LDTILQRVGATIGRPASSPFVDAVTGTVSRPDDKISEALKLYFDEIVRNEIFPTPESCLLPGLCLAAGASAHEPRTGTSQSYLTIQPLPNDVALPGGRESTTVTCKPACVRKALNRRRQCLRQ